MPLNDILTYLQTTENLNFPAQDFVDDSEANQADFRNYLLTCPIAIENQHGDDTTFHAAFEGKLLGLSPEVTYDLMWDIYNVRCEPPWTAQGMLTKVINAYKHTKAPIGAANATQAFASVAYKTGPVYDDALRELEVEYTEWKIDRLRPQAGYSPILCNAMNCFLEQEYTLEDNETKIRTTFTNVLYRSLRFNEFSNQIEWAKPAPWHKPNSPRKYWDDGDVVQSRAWLSHKRRFDLGSQVMQDCALAVSKLYTYHPVRQWLDSLKWDGVARLETWLKDYCQASDTPYTRVVGQCTLIAAVARIFDPGVQHDSMLILEGEQGTGKTSLVRLLGGPWYADIKIDPGNRDTIDAMQGAWFIEASELEYSRNIDVQAMKRFLTITKDKVRLAYARNSIELPRQNVFVGTVNPGSKPSYLSDTDGNRRFWPVYTKQIHLEKFGIDRPQLFAEAVERYRNGEKFYLNDPAIIAQANNEAMLRVAEDAWLGIIAEWLKDGELPEALTTQHIANGALNLQPRELDRLNNSRISRCMEKLGYERYQRRIHGSRTWSWRVNALGDLW